MENLTIFQGILEKNALFDGKNLILEVILRKCSIKKEKSLTKNASIRILLGRLY